MLEIVITQAPNAEGWFLLTFFDGDEMLGDWSFKKDQVDTEAFDDSVQKMLLDGTTKVIEGKVLNKIAKDFVEGKVKLGQRVAYDDYE